MPSRVFRTALLVALLAWPGPAASQNQSTQEALEALPWTVGAGFRTVPGVDATYWQSADQIWLSGEDVTRMATLAQAEVGAQTAVGVAIDVDDETIIGIQYNDSGYIEQTRLENLQPAVLFDIMKQVMESRNTERRRNGRPTVELVGYAIEPWYDAQRNAAYWAVRRRESDGTEDIHALAVKLARGGFAVISWIGPREQFAGRRTMETTLAAFRFNDGARYADFRDGDPVAQRDLEDLVAHLAGVPPSVVTALTLMKYAGVVLLLPLIFAGLRYYWRQS